MIIINNLAIQFGIINNVVSTNRVNFIKEFTSIPIVQATLLYMNAINESVTIKEVGNSYCIFNSEASINPQERKIHWIAIGFIL